MLPDSARELIESGALAHLVTLNEDGSPQVTCVWVGIDGDELVSGHLSAQQRKLRNVRRDPRVALSFEGTQLHPPGMKEYLVVHGRARLEEGRRGRAVAAPRARLPRSGREVPADGRPTAGICDADRGRAGRRRRALALVTKRLRRLRRLDRRRC
jgi:PPOX class probable F420-dependent enzyme